MNSFILELFDDDFPLCTFYTVRWPDAAYTETEKFIESFQESAEYEDDFNQIMALLELMGEKEGARQEFFTRHEDEASALPPKRLRFVQIPLAGNQLRLYCVRISESIVVLFNGGLKTAQTAQNSEDLQSKFREAKVFARRIWEEIQDGILKVNEVKHRIELFNDPDEENIHII